LRDLSRTRALLVALAEDGLAELRAGWRQHALTLLGIVWGSAAVVILLSIGAGFYKNLQLGFEKTGDRYVMAIGQYTTTELGGARPGRRIVFERVDIERVRGGAASARWVAGELQRAGVAARTPHRTRTAVVSAATPELRFIKNHRVARGRFFDADDEGRARRVAVIGASLAEVFFGAEDPIGRTIHLDGRPFEVIGVLARKGAQYVTNSAPHDEMVFVPLSQGQRLFARGDALDAILVAPWRLDEAKRLEAELRAALLPFHRVSPEDDEAIHVMSIPEITAPFVKIALGLELLLGFIGTVVLAMAGVGVANLMVAIVNRRRVELAMRRACGARRRDVILQLLIETLVVVLAGGLLGVAIGSAAGWAISRLPMPEFIPGPRLEWSVVATSFVVLVAVGLGAGLSPARAASRVDPALALRVT
jgi:putative ABC transport system permease protein